MAWKIFLTETCVKKDILENKQDSLSTIKYKYTYKLKYVIMYLYIMYKFIHINLCMYMCIYVCVYIGVCVYVLQCTYILTYKHPNFWSVYMHIYTCTCVYYTYHRICS